MSSSSADTILETQGLTKEFGNLVAVDDVDFTIERGSTVGLIGPNGAGKTTFQSLLSGEHAATDGSILFEGDEITGTDPYRRARMGIIKKFQVTRVYGSESILENMRMAMRGRLSSTWELLRSHDDSALDDRIHELLDVANLRHKKHENAENLSHGEQQWLEIVMAVSTDPKLLLLDEPTSGMGPQETNETVGLLRTIKEETETTLLVVEHDMDFIQKVSNNLTVLHHGEILAQGTVEDIQNNDKVQEVYLGRE
jgi:ABC-type branched-subunit amino acid transport system ATPase component